MMHILLFILFIIIVLVEKLIEHNQSEKLGWKVSKENYKKIIYSEKIAGKWEQIDIQAHINIGTFEPQFKDENEWKDYPKWAHNRMKIINRVKKKFPLKGEILCSEELKNTDRLDDE